MAQSADSTCLCEICIGGPGEYYCQQCDQLFCGNCKLSHLRAKISKNHTFFSGQNINKEEKRLCIEHEERFLFYCHDCDTPVCSSCSVQTHKGHLMNDLTKSAVKLKFELIKIIESTITTSTSCIGTIEEDTKTYHQKTKAVNKTITEEGNYYKELIDKKVNSFVKLVQDETQKALGSMSTATKVYLDILEHCQQWQKKITEMETKSDVLLFKKLKHLKTDVDQIVLKQSLDTPRHSVSYTNKELSDTDIDNLFGELTFHRNTDVCPDCNRKEQHMHRNKAERNELKKDRQEIEKILTNYSSVRGRSDTEKENISLRAELTEALKNIEKIRQDYSNLSEKYETGKIATKRTIESLEREKGILEQEKANFRAKLDQIQSDLKRYKNEQVHEQDSSHGKIDNLLQQNRKLENDRELLRGKNFSLENDKIKLEDLYETVNKERSKQDTIVAQHMEENNGLKKELKKAKAELHKTERERDKFSQNLQQELDCGKQDLDRLKKEKTELVTQFEVQLQKYSDKIYKLELEIKTLHERYSSGEKKSQYYAYELMQLKSNYETCKKQKTDVENELLHLKLSFTDIENKLREKESNQNQIREQYEQEIRKLKRQFEENKERLQENNEEKLSLNEENQRLRNVIVEKEREVKNLESRFQELADSKQNLEVLQNRIENLHQEKSELIQRLQELEVLKRQVHKLDFENSELNKRLEINNKEKTSILKENKELKNILQEKLSEVKRLEARLQQYAEKFEDIPALKMHMEKLQSDNDELHLKSKSATCHRENMYEMGSELFMGRSPSSLQERYNTFGSKSDTEKENISLKSELTEALENIEELKQEYKGLSERYEKEIKAAKRTVDRLQGENNSLEQDKANWKAKLDQIQSDLNRYKNEQVHEQDSSHGTIENLLQQNRKLDNDRELLRGKIFSLENDKIKLEDLLNKSKEDHKKLQRDQDELQGSLREKSNELRGSETRYQKETSNRMSSDKISTKYKEDNDRLRKERNSARTELQRVLREKKESYQNLNTEQVLAKEELQSKEREKLELVALFKDKEDKNLQKIKLYEKEIENLKSRCRDYNEKIRQSEHEIETLKSKLKDNNEKIQRFEHEIYTLKSSCIDDNVQVQQIQRMELEIETLKSRHRDDNNKMRQTERENETLKSRLTGEKSKQYSSYEMLQNKYELEACKHQKKALEDERNELQRENMELENELQSLNSKLEQIDDSEKNISNLKKHIKDLEEGYRNAVTNVQTLTESDEDQKQENRDLIVKLENLDKEKKDLENKLRVMFNKDETSKLQKDNVELMHNLQDLSKQLKESENRLVLKEREQSSIIEECEELKRILKEKHRELSRLNELKDAKESSDVLRKQVQEVQFEFSELNRRLEESNKENSSLRKENKTMENSLKEKLAEEKKMNARFQQYAEKFEEIPALKRHMDKVQSENTDLNLKCRHLQTLEKEVQMLKKENQQLKTENISQRQNIETQKNRLEILNGEKLEIEDKLRLSEAAGNKLRDNNPNIADLSDMNRPISLAEKFSSLYTDEYRDAMEVIEDDMVDAASVKVMLDWLKRCYEWCQRLAKEQRETLINRSIGFMENHGGQKVVLSDRCLIFVKEFQKKIAVESLAVVGQICHVKSVTQHTLSSENYIVKYIKKCSELCWMMQISDPPLYLNFDVNSGENLNKNDYNVFTKSGSKIDYLVWPVLYLHKTGPMLAKGVAQGK